MSGTGLGPGLRDALERIRAATRSLVEAAGAEEADAIDPAVADRAEAVASLRRSLERARGDMSDSSGAEPGSATGELAADLAGAKAEAELRRLLANVGDALESLARGAQAVRGHAGSSKSGAHPEGSG